MLFAVRLGKPVTGLLPLSARRRVHRILSGGGAAGGAPSLRSPHEAPLGGAGPDRLGAVRLPALLAEPAFAACGQLPLVTVVVGDGPAEALARTCGDVAAQSYPCLELLVVGQGVPAPGVTGLPLVRHVHSADPSALRDDVVARARGDVLAWLPPGVVLARDELATAMVRLLADPAGRPGWTGAVAVADSSEGFRSAPLAEPPDHAVMFRVSPAPAVAATGGEHTAAPAPAPGPGPRGAGATFGCLAIDPDAPVDLTMATAVVARSPGSTIVVAGPQAERDRWRAVLAAGNLRWVEATGTAEALRALTGVDALWAPEVATPGQARRALLRAYALGLPLVLPTAARPPAAPYQFGVDPGRGSLDAVAFVARVRPDPLVLRSYLACWSALDGPAAADPATRPGPGGPRLRCLLVTGRLGTGGIEEMVALLANGLPHHGVEVTVVCFGTGAVAERLRREGVEVIDAGDRGGGVRELFTELRPDVVSAHHAPDAAIAAAAALGVPVVATLHLSMFPPGGRRDARMDRLVAVSELARDRYLAAHPDQPRDRIVVVPNGIDLLRLRLQERASARARLGLRDEFLLLSLARHHPQKNQFGLLAAFDAFARERPDAHLLVAGNVDDRVYLAQVEDLRRRLPTGDRIHLRANGSDPGALLSAADAFVLDSFFEGHPLAPMEAVYAGLPLVCAEVAGTPEQVGRHGERGILVPNPSGDARTIDDREVRRLTYRTRQANTDELVAALGSVHRDRGAWQVRRGSQHAQARRLFASDRCVAAHAAQLRLHDGRPR